VPKLPAEIPMKVLAVEPQQAWMNGCELPPMVITPTVEPVVWLGNNTNSYGCDLYIAVRGACQGTGSGHQGDGKVFSICRSSGTRDLAVSMQDEVCHVRIRCGVAFKPERDAL
jgi:hypothetical protein